MASKGKKKGKTIPLTDFLANESKLVTVRATNWSEIVDNEEEAEVKPIVIDIGNLPTAPRSAHDIDFSTVPTNPPFVARVSNLSFQVDDQGLRNIFADLNPKTARVLRDGMRSKGVGLVEFETRENLLDALKRSEKEFYGRSIHVDVSDKTNISSDGGRSGFGHNRSNRTGEERPEMADRWKRAENRSDEPSEDRPSGGYNRENRSNRGDGGRSHMGGPRNNQHGTDYGFGYPRPKDDRQGGGSGGNREYNNRQGPRNRYPDDGNRPNSRGDRPSYTGRYSDNRDTRDSNRSNVSEETQDEPRETPREPPRERQRLQLQPRTKPIEDNQPLPGTSSSVNNTAQSSVSNSEDSPSVTNKFSEQDSPGPDNENQNESQEANNHPSDDQPTLKPSRGAGASIFGGAKPVDTAARELEIEKKYRDQQMSTEGSADQEDKGTSRPSYNRGGDRDGHRAKRSSQTDDGRSGHGVDYHHKREFSGGRQYEDEGRKRDDQPRRGGGDRDRFGGPSRRDHDSGRKGKYNHHNQSDRDNDRGNYRPREERNLDSNEFTSAGRPSNNNYNSETQSRNQQRGAARRTIKNDDDSHKLQLSNKFDMLGMEDADDNNENDDVQSPTFDD